MKIIINPPNYNGCQILCRVYANQSPEYWRSNHRDENEQICAEILFHENSGINHKNMRGCSWLPRGSAYFIVEQLKQFEHLDIAVYVSNELEDNVGVLEYCRDNFEKSMLRRIRETNLKTEVILIDANTGKVVGVA